jgi:predicted acylesterase/phospholipase RssA
MASDTQDPADRAPVDRFCDLVMKGGITSGVVYPLAIAELAKSYRFKNIGGTSAGAIAATATAAAEYRRRCHDSMAGFERLKQLPQQLGEPVNGRSRLLSLFQPAPATQRLFKLLLSTLNRRSTGLRWLGGLLGLLQAYWLPALIGAVGAWLLLRLAGLLFGTPGLLGLTLSSAIAALGMVGWAVYRDVVQGVVPNGFGLCNCGPPQPGAPSVGPALVPWLHQLIQETAGRAPGEPPLSFADLAGAPGFNPAWFDLPAGANNPSINLQVFTTNLTHGRPYHLPLSGRDSPLYFTRGEWKHYFPDDVIGHLVARAQPLDVAGRSGEDTLLELPHDDLPIVVAARLSLSFPLLISAVPLWAVEDDPDDHPHGGAPRLKRCWFSDGGISSNFPIHLFDGLVPRWPTFGITLEARRADAGAVWIPQLHTGGRSENWASFDDKTAPISRLGGFLGSIVGTMQNWNDNTATRMPGVRDRVVHVRLNPDEGGLNLNMPPALIQTLGSYGTQAGACLRSKFVPPHGSAMLAPSWREHRWVRFNVLIAGLREKLSTFGAVSRLSRHAQPLREQIDAACAQPPLQEAGHPAPLQPAEAQALRKLLDALEEGAQVFAHESGQQSYVADPMPSLRIRSPL